MRRHRSRPPTLALAPTPSPATTTLPSMRRERDVRLDLIDRHDRAGPRASVGQEFRAATGAPKRVIRADECCLSRFVRSLVGPSVPSTYGAARLAARTTWRVVVGMIRGGGLGRGPGCVTAARVTSRRRDQHVRGAVRERSVGTTPGGSAGPALDFAGRALAPMAARPNVLLAPLPV